MNSRPQSLQVRAPGKLILSGEHAVVYGQPALALAVNRHVTATVSRELLPQILFDLADLAHHSHFSLDGLKKLKQRVKRKYHRFIRGEYSIRDVLEKPFELAQFALGAFTDSMRVTLPHGVKIRVHSDIPVGCGMGSSAATIVSVMSAISHYLQIPLTNDALYKLALEAENMQHGHSSGLDLRVAMQGGCLYLHDGVIDAASFPVLSMCLVNTGTPLSSTGECVESVASLFKTSTIGDDFGAVTRSLHAALQSGTNSAIIESVRANQRLLTSLGVVPEPVQAFVREVEQSGAAAKVCGAGAVRGDQAGIVLMMADDMDAMSALCANKGYEMMQISCEARGVYVV